MARRTASLGLSVACLVATAGATSAQVDLSVAGLRIVQTLPNVTLIAGKSLMVRAAVESNPPAPPGTMVDALLRVYVGGVEIPESPFFTQNGPIFPPTPVTVTNLDDTLNFVLLPPAGTDVTLVVEVNPAGPNQVAETNFSNNIYTSAPLTFECKRRPELVYVEIDNPGQGGLPVPGQSDPGRGDNFVQGIYPSDDWDYFVSPNSPKFWSQSLSSSGSALLSSLITDLQMMSPRPDFIYGWVRGGLPYNGQASGIPGLAGMGNTQNTRFQRTFAHELGHCFGRVHINNTIGSVGIDVETHLAIPQQLGQIKVSTLFDIMVAGLLTNQAWVYPFNYEFFVNHNVFQCSTESPVYRSGRKNLLVGGLWNTESGELTLTDTVAFEGGSESSLVPVDQGNLLLRVTAAGEPYEFGILANTPTDCAEDSTDSKNADSEGLVDPIVSFVVVLPDSIDPATVEELSLVDAVSGVELRSIKRSDSAPAVELVSPRPGTVVDAALRLEWSASDADGSRLEHYVRYSPDGEQVVPLGAKLTGNGFDIDLARLPKFQPDKGWLEVLTTDGLNTTQVRTSDLQLGATLEALGGLPPTTFVLSPDPGSTFQRGASVILHSSGWDPEDRSLRGASVVWTSDLDGVIGTGRVALANDLSVGNHVLTVTVTDSSGMTAMASTPVTITNRSLPNTGGVTCQPDIGFGGPGTSLLEVCGGDLSSGTSADVMLTGAAPNQLLWIASGDMSNPTPVLGGILVPVPVINIFPATTDATGSWSLPNGVAGGGGPATLYIQAVYTDPGSPSGFGISNAVAAAILP